MALKMTKADVWAGALQDVPGGLAGVLDGLADAGANLQFIIARRDPANPGRGQVFITPIRGKRVESAAGAAGLRRADNIATLRIEGADRPGLGRQMMRAIADEGINVRGVSAAVSGAKFIAYLGFDSQADADRAAGALRSVNGRARGGGGGRGGRKRTAKPRRAIATRRR